MRSDGIDILFVRPTDRDAIYGTLSTAVSAVEPPLWTAWLAAVARREGFNVRIIDAEVEPVSPESVAASARGLGAALVVFTVVGSNLSASTWHMEGARRYLAAFADDATLPPTMLWGLHPSALPRRTLEEETADFLCEGEGFHTITALAGVLKAGNRPGHKDIPGLWHRHGGRIVCNRRQRPVERLDELPGPAWDLLPMDRYRAHNWHCFETPDRRTPYAVVCTSLGCPFDCDFCNLKMLLGGPGVRFRSPRKVLEDIDRLVYEYGVRHIKVLDECFVLRASHVHAICDLLIERGYDLNIWAYARVDTVTEPLLHKLRQAGFRWLAFGIESATAEVRNGVSKGQYTRDDIVRAVEMTNRAGIHVLANFMFGLPDDDLDSMQRTLDLAMQLNAQYTNFYSTKAYPGSRLYQQALADGVPLPDSWRGYPEFSEDCLPLPTKHLTGEEVLAFRDRAFVEFHSRPEYLNMLESRFGPAAATQMRNVLTHRLKRRHRPQPLRMMPCR